jgi:hypothetical protein
MARLVARSRMLYRSGKERAISSPLWAGLHALTAGSVAVPVLSGHATHSPSRGNPAASQSVNPPEYRRTFG